MDSMILGRYIPGDSIVHRIGSTQQITGYDATDFDCVLG